jgi:hypothetical protein
MSITSVVLEDVKNLTPQERIDVFAKVNNKDLELVMHHCSIELQERALIEEEEDALALQTAEDRLIWKDKQ